MQLLGGKTGYNDFARYCLVVATKIDGRAYYMAFLGDEGKLTRFGDVARVADWIVSHKAKTAIAAATRGGDADADDARGERRCAGVGCTRSPRVTVATAAREAAPAAAADRRRGAAGGAARPPPTATRLTARRGRR